MPNVQLPKRPLLAGWGEPVKAEPLAQQVTAEQVAARSASAARRRRARRTLRRWRLLVIVRRARLLPLRWMLERVRLAMDRWSRLAADRPWERAAQQY